MLRLLPPQPARLPARPMKVKASEHKAAQYHDSASDAFKTAKEKAAQFEESASDAVKTAKQNAAELQTSVVEKAKDAADVVSANISATAGKAADLAVAAAGELRRNLTEILRQTRELGRDTAAFVGAGKAVRSVAAVTHLLGTATAYGACIWVTFASSHVLAEALPRQQFGVVQSRLYPLYFRFVAVGVAVAFGGHLLRRGWRSGRPNAGIHFNGDACDCVGESPLFGAQSHQSHVRSNEDGEGRRTRETSGRFRYRGSHARREGGDRGRNSGGEEEAEEAQHLLFHL
ncbi:hypothetical protein HPP92_005686 [Vanilla planifolia]|uniref:TMEM205-like domain-containing protein n=1 Tax=Vanilla planifolia TaxID=51239 RepID=A0A835RUD1_VANPL|nr:hypothetical protein HPP92_005686 [Vanilla planifolia]